MALVAMALDQDRQAVELAASGDRAATEAVLRRLLPRVRNLVRYLLRGDTGVDDAAQEALLAVLRGLSSYRGEGSLEAWADRITARATFAWLRRQRAAPASSAQAELPEQLPDTAAGPDDYALRRQAAQLLDQLPAEQRHACALHHVAGFTVPEIAELLDLSPETVRSRLRLARKRLRAAASQESPS